MAETPETTADITAKMRNYSNDCNDGYHTDYGVVLEDMRNFADRLDAAIARERGDCAKLREALFASRDFIDRVLMFLHGMETTFPGENEIIDKIRSALGEAPKMATDPRSHIFKI